MSPRDAQFLVLAVLFAVAYPCVSLPLFQWVSVRRRGRRFRVRLGTPWHFEDPEHRHDVLMSFASLVAGLALAGGAFELLVALGWIEGRAAR